MKVNRGLSPFIQMVKIRNELLEYLTDERIAEAEIFFEQKSNELSELFRLECLGNISFYKREFADAIGFYETAYNIAPDHIISRHFYLAGVKNEREENFVDAFKYYQAAIEAEPSFVDAYVELGGLLMTVEDFEGAVKCYEDAVTLEPSELSNHANLKAALAKLGQQ